MSNKWQHQQQQQLLKLKLMLQQVAKVPLRRGAGSRRGSRTDQQQQQQQVWQPPCRSQMLLLLLLLMMMMMMMMMMGTWGCLTPQLWPPLLCIEMQLVVLWQQQGWQQLMVLWQQQGWQQQEEFSAIMLVVLIQPITPLNAPALLWMSVLPAITSQSCSRICHIAPMMMMTLMMMTLMMMTLMTPFLWPSGS
jgi:hypothetical protein